MATTILQKSHPLKEIIYSSVKKVVDHGKYIFDTLGDATPSKKKINDIEKGLGSARTVVLENKEEIRKDITDLDLELTTYVFPPHLAGKN